MRKLLSSLLASFIVTAGIAMTPSHVEALGLPLLPNVKIEPALSAVLAAAKPTDKIRVVATFNALLSAPQVSSLLSLVSRADALSRLPMALIEATPAQIAAVKLLPGLVSLHIDKQLSYSLHESVPLIGADQAWTSIGYDGTGVTVAVVDSGIDGLHGDLTSNVVHNVKLVGEGDLLADFYVPLSLPNSDTSSGHGTHVAGTVAGTGSQSAGYYTGVAPGANLVGIGTGDALFIFTALTAFNYVLENKETYKINVVTNSWGTTGAYDANDPINVASKKLNDSGLVVLFASGNEGPGNDTLNPYSVAPWVIGVAAGNKDGQTIADFSSRGVPGSSVYHPTITAPGAGIVSTRALNTVLPVLGLPDDVAINPAYLPFYTTMSGTSMATPHMAGVAALILQANPDLSPAAVKNLIITTAIPMSGYSEHEVGAGYVDAYTAVHQAAFMP